MRKLHLWLSLPAGLFITLICLTGAILVFQQELLEIFNQERYFVTASTKSTALHLDTLAARGNQALNKGVNRENASADTIVALKIFPDTRRTIEATLSSGARSYVYLNPYTAEITGYYNARAGFFHKVMALHRWLMLPHREAGRLIVGGSTIFLIFILITGIARWCRKPSFKLKKGSGWKRKLFDLHRVLGIYASIILLVCALTGLMWSFGWYRTAVARVLGIETTARVNASKETFQRTQVEESNNTNQVLTFWQSAYDRITVIYPRVKYITIRSSGGISVLPTQALHPRATDTYQYHKKERRLALLSQYGDQKNQSFMMGIAYVLHVGSWGGNITRWLSFLAALLGASLPITGYILFFARHTIQISRTQRTK